LQRWEGGLTETKVYGMALKAGDAAPVFLPVAWCLAAERIAPDLFRTSGAQCRILSIGDFYQIGLEAVIFPALEEFARDGRSVIEVIAELITRTVQQHLRVA
jgi:hypothetical protein